MSPKTFQHSSYMAEFWKKPQNPTVFHLTRIVPCFIFCRESLRRERLSPALENFWPGKACVIDGSFKDDCHSLFFLRLWGALWSVVMMMCPYDTGKKMKQANPVGLMDSSPSFKDSAGWISKAACQQGLVDGLAVLSLGAGGTHLLPSRHELSRCSEAFRQGNAFSLLEHFRKTIVLMSVVRIDYCCSVHAINFGLQ